MSIIDQRQSVRKFDERPVEASKVVSMVQAGMAAPSSKNKQPFQFIVVDDLDMIAEFTEIHPSWKGLKTANKIIVACGDKSRDERDAQMLMAVSAATQNMLLRGVELGLGTVWIGMYPDEVRMEYAVKRLGLPKHIVPISIVAIGYNDNVKEKVRDLNPERIKFNGWQETAGQ